MTDREEALRAAQHAVKEAKTVENGDVPAKAEALWERAERLYEAAGVDADWFDDAARVEAADEFAPPMRSLWLFPTTLIELTYEPGTDEPIGVVADVEDLTRIDP